MSVETIIKDKKQLLEYFEKGCKSSNNLMIGSEHEQFVFQLPELRRAPFEGHRGIEALLYSFREEGWQPILEYQNIIALKHESASITLEPGGQFELSGATFKTLHETHNEMILFRNHLYKNCRSLGLAILDQGLDPKTLPDQMPWMPKDRYKIMRNYMPQIGQLGLYMMADTATVQVNLDYLSESDWVKKFRVAMALQPLTTAIFANSPIHQGRLTGFKSFRGHIWTDTDPDRCGLLPFAFEDNLSFEKYLEYLLDVPMYFVIRNDEYENHAGHSFRDFMGGNLPFRKGEFPTMDDFHDHVSVVFPEVRLKHYLEMRGADGGSVPHNMALCAFWVGLLYDSSMLDHVFEYTRKWTYEDVSQLQRDVTIQGLATQFLGRPLQEIAVDICKLSKRGLKSRAKLSSSGLDESIYLKYAEDLIEKGRCPADSLIHEFVYECQEDVDRFLLRNLKRETETLPLN